MQEEMKREEGINYEEEYKILVQKFNNLVNELQEVSLRAQMYEEWALIYKKENMELRQLLNNHQH